jgi:hypothetical protein
MMKKRTLRKRSTSSTEKGGGKRRRGKGDGGEGDGGKGYDGKGDGGKGKGCQGKKEYFLFQYQAPYGPNKRGRYSSLYLSVHQAAKAIFQWAGADWPSRVVGQGEEKKEEKEGEGQQGSEETEKNQVAPKEVSTRDPLSAAEAAVLDSVAFIKKGTRTKDKDKDKEVVEWCAFKEAAARAIYAWAGEDWKERVKLTPGFKRELALQCKEDTITGQVRKIREPFMQRLLKKLTPEALQHMTEDPLPLATLVEDDELRGQILDLAHQHNPPEGSLEEILQQTLKCETDPWQACDWRRPSCSCSSPARAKDQS